MSEQAAAERAGGATEVACANRLADEGGVQFRATLWMLLVPVVVARVTVNDYGTPSSPAVAGAAIIMVAVVDSATTAAYMDPQRNGAVLIRSEPDGGGDHGERVRFGDRAAGLDAAPRADPDRRHRALHRAAPPHRLGGGVCSSSPPTATCTI